MTIDITIWSKVYLHACVVLFNKNYRILPYSFILFVSLKDKSLVKIIKKNYEFAE